MATTVQNIYRKYDIMPTLQLHMLRVAAVAKEICTHYNGPPVDMTSIVAACLVHDMGNILKFQLTRFPDFLEPKGLTYWENAQEKFREQYGSNESVATELIIEEIGVSKRVKELVAVIGFKHGQANIDSNDFEKKICDYADTRVDPHGIVSLDNRLKDLEKRYSSKHPTEEEKIQSSNYSSMLHAMESQIFAHCSIKPDQITNGSVDDTISSLRFFVVPLKEKQAE